MFPEVGASKSEKATKVPQSADAVGNETVTAFELSPIKDDGENSACWRE